MVTPEENANDIKCVERDLVRYKEHHSVDHLSQTASISSMSTTLQTISDTLVDIKKDQKAMNDTLTRMEPTVKSLSEVEIPSIKKEQEEIKQFRWRAVGITSVLSIIAIAVVSGVISLTFRQCESDKYIKRDEIRNIYKFSESLKIKEAEASESKKEGPEIYETNP